MKDELVLLEEEKEPMQIDSDKEKSDPKFINEGIKTNINLTSMPLQDQVMGMEASRAYGNLVNIDYEYMDKFISNDDYNLNRMKDISIYEQNEMNSFQLPKLSTIRTDHYMQKLEQYNLSFNSSNDIKKNEGANIIYQDKNNLNVKEIDLFSTTKCLPELSNKSKLSSILKKYQNIMMKFLIDNKSKEELLNISPKDFLSKIKLLTEIYSTSFVYNHNINVNILASEILNPIHDSPLSNCEKNNEEKVGLLLFEISKNIFSYYNGKNMTYKMQIENYYLIYQASLGLDQSYKSKNLLNADFHLKNNINLLSFNKSSNFLEKMKGKHILEVIEYEIIELFEKPINKFYKETYAKIKPIIHDTKIIWATAYMIDQAVCFLIYFLYFYFIPNLFYILLKNTSKITEFPLNLGNIKITQEMFKKGKLSYNIFLTIMFLNF